MNATAPSATKQDLRYLVEEARANAVELWERNDNDTRDLDTVLDTVENLIKEYGIDTVLEAQGTLYRIHGIA